MIAKHRRVFAFLLIVAPTFAALGCGSAPPEPAPTVSAPAPANKVDPGPPSALRRAK